MERPLSAEAFDDYRGMQGARCSFTVSIDVRQVGQGGYSVDPVSGSIGLMTLPPLSR